MKVMYYADKVNKKVHNCLLEGFNGYGKLGKKALIHVEHYEFNDAGLIKGIESIPMLVSEKSIFETEEEAINGLK